MAASFLWSRINATVDMADIERLCANEGLKLFKASALSGEAVAIVLTSLAEQANDCLYVAFIELSSRPLGATGSPSSKTWNHPLHLIFLRV